MAGSVGSEDGDVGFQIAPMVDVVFVLLLFFMASAGSQVVERELNISLPSGRGAASTGPPPTPVIIDISAEGVVTMNSKIFDNPTSKEMPELRARLKENIERFGDKDPVIIRPNNDARQERIIDVLNSAAAAGVKNLTFS
ncbi:MAG: biopolymer transporter ExbD [Chthoniobacterales bacterium]|nr:biopolymer transporter ExbD [Chthoniobacterales bacterium]